VLTEHGDPAELCAGLAVLVLLFISDLTDDPVHHVNLMFTAVEVAERGRDERYSLKARGLSPRLLRRLAASG
jgi:hypothetical protein